jgi:hypothetical protein
MQSSGTRPDSPDQDQDTPLQPLFHSEGSSDPMPVSKKAGTDRGMMDNVGLGLVVVRRSFPFRSQLMHVGWLRAFSDTHLSLGIGRKLSCKSLPSHLNITDLKSYGWFTFHPTLQSLSIASLILGTTFSS